MNHPASTAIPPDRLTRPSGRPSPSASPGEPGHDGPGPGQGQVPASHLAGGGRGPMIRKTMRVGALRTSIKLEQEFWSHLKEVAAGRSIRLSVLVNEIAAAALDRTNLASTLRTFSLMHARRRAQTLRSERDRLALASNGPDLTRVLDACPMPCLILDAERAIRQLNRAFALWLNLDLQATIGKRLGHVMILRGTGLEEMWAGLLEGRQAQGRFSATYVSPGRARTSQAVAVALASGGEPGRGGCVVLFETLVARH